MMLPGLISLVFYKRLPTPLQFTLGLIASVALGAVIGYPFPGTPIRGGPVIAAVSAAILYVAIVAFLYYRFRSKATPSQDGTPPGATH